MSGRETAAQIFGFLALAAMVLVTVSMSVRRPNTLRLLMLTATPFALAYDILIGSIGGSVNETISFISALTAFLRNARKGTGTSAEGRTPPD